MLLKGMGENFLLSKDEPLTPNIDGVMGQFLFFSPRPLEKIRSNLFILELPKRPRYDKKVR